MPNSYRGTKSWLISLWEFMNIPDPVYRTATEHLDDVIYLQKKLLKIKGPNAITSAWNLGEHHLCSPRRFIHLSCLQTVPQWHPTEHRSRHLIPTRCMENNLEWLVCSLQQMGYVLVFHSSSAYLPKSINQSINWSPVPQFIKASTQSNWGKFTQQSLHWCNDYQWYINQVMEGMFNSTAVFSWGKNF